MKPYLFDKFCLVDSKDFICWIDSIFRFDKFSLVGFFGKFGSVDFIYNSISSSSPVRPCASLSLHNASKSFKIL